MVVPGRQDDGSLRVKLLETVSLKEEKAGSASRRVTTRRARSRMMRVAITGRGLGPAGGA
jgi:hypothetical protein